MVRTHLLFLRTLMACILMAALHCRAQVRDVEMKAAYIYNFAQFTSWPEQRAREPFRVCANIGSALWSSLQAYNGKPVNGRNWSTVEMRIELAERSCDLLLLARSADRVPPTPGLLVIRDGPGSAGAAITLVDDDEQLRFDIDTREAARSGLRFSSKLLRLARTVL